jgi:phosphate transport system substrate-binding protein
MKTLRNLSLIIMIVTLAACNGGSIISTNTPTSGVTKIAVDESYTSMIQTQIDLFEALYPYATIKVINGPESDMIDLFLKDSVEVVFTGRKLTADEEKFLVSNQFVPKTTKVAQDGLALIVNSENTDSLLRFDQISDIFTGKISDWKQIDPKSVLGKMAVIFDNNKSANPRFIRERFKISGGFPDYCYAVNSNEEVVKFVQHNPHALGILSVDWISDKNDTLSNKFQKTFRVVSVGPEGDISGAQEFKKPYQAYIAEGSYPLCRDVYVINRETYAGLGTGFAAFVAGEKGQRVILKSGLVPATMPIRLVQVKSQ